MASVDCSKISYAAEKFSSLERSLAIGKGDARTRLANAYWTFHVICPCDLPPPLRQDLAWVYAQVTKRAARHPGEGEVEATTATMKSETAARILSVSASCRISWCARRWRESGQAETRFWSRGQPSAGTGVLATVGRTERAAAARDRGTVVRLTHHPVGAQQHRIPPNAQFAALRARRRRRNEPDRETLDRRGQFADTHIDARRVFLRVVRCHVH